MKDQKEIIARFIVEYYDKETIPIFDSTNAFELKNNITFKRENEIDDFFIGGKIEIEEKTYVIKDFQISVYSPLYDIKPYNMTILIQVADLNNE